MKSKLFISLGLALVTCGALIPFLIVLQILPNTYFLAFLSYASTVSGLFLGLIGSATYVRERKS